MLCFSNASPKINLKKKKPTCLFKCLTMEGDPLTFYMMVCLLSELLTLLHVFHPSALWWQKLLSRSEPREGPCPILFAQAEMPFERSSSAGLVLPGAGGRWTPRRSHLGTPHGAAGWGCAWSTSLCHCKQPPARGISAPKAARPCPKQVLCFGSNSKED